MGRPKGSLNKYTREAREAAAYILDSPEYRKSLIARVIAGTLPPLIEQMLWAYRYGKPREVVDVNLTQQTDLSDLTEEQLARRAEQIHAAIVAGHAMEPESARVDYTPGSPLIEEYDRLAGSEELNSERTSETSTTMDPPTSGAIH